MDNIENYKSALASVSKKEMEQRKVIKKLLQDKEELKKQLDLYSVVSSKTLSSRIANKRERLKGDLDNATNIINGSKGMSSDYIIDKARNMPFLRCKLNLIDELLDD